MRDARWILVPFVLAALGVPVASADQPRDAVVRVVVRDSAGLPVPYAWIQQRNGASRVASDSGVALLPGQPADSLRLIGRRIGFSPFEAWVRRDSATGDYAVRLSPLARVLTPVDVRERANTPLARTGFYDRMARAQRGATSARFFTPEELDLRNPPRTSNVLSGENSVRVNYSNGKVLLTGRQQNCPMTVLIDGRRVRGTVEEVYTREGSEEIRRLMRERDWRQDQAMDYFLRSRQSIDELVASVSVAAIELYASAAAVPSELQQNMASDACGLIAIWTGARQ